MNINQKIQEFLTEHQYQKKRRIFTAVLSLMIVFSVVSSLIMPAISMTMQDLDDAAAVDTIDAETWSNTNGDPRFRICRHEDWFRYLTDEMVPFIHAKMKEYQPDYINRGIITFGCSLGATHAANLYFRRPDLFNGLLALSGIYDASYGFGSYMDDLVYMNSPVHYLPNLPSDHPYMELYRQRKAILCVGQGAWEEPASTYQLRDILQQKQIPAWLDFWGYDCAHDWDWWYKQVTYFVPHLLYDPV